MGKPQTTFSKRQREQAKRDRQRAKAERRLQRKNEPPQSEFEEIAPEGLEPVSVDSTLPD